MESIAQKFFHKIKVMLEPLASRIPYIAIELHPDARLINLVHDCSDSRQLASIAVCLQANLLTVIGGKLTDNIQRPGNLPDGLFPRDIVVKAVRENPYAAAANVPAELDKDLSIFYGCFELCFFRRIRC